MLGEAKGDIQLKMNNSPALSKTSILSVSFFNETYACGSCQYGAAREKGLHT
jgi:hypothetical protein